MEVRGYVVLAPQWRPDVGEDVCGNGNVNGWWARGRGLGLGRRVGGIVGLDVVGAPTELEWYPWCQWVGLRLERHLETC